jgi:hypothetical protein
MLEEGDILLSSVSTKCGLQVACDDGFATCDSEHVWIRKNQILTHLITTSIVALVLLGIQEGEMWRERCD